MSSRDAKSGHDVPPDQLDKRRRELSPAARRALDEAARRRAEIDARTTDRDREVAGRDGLEPTRYGDWEKNGIASDF